MEGGGFVFMKRFLIDFSVSSFFSYASAAFAFLTSILLAKILGVSLRGEYFLYLFLPQFLFTCFYEFLPKWLSLRNKYRAPGRSLDEADYTLIWILFFSSSLFISLYSIVTVNFLTFIFIIYFYFNAFLYVLISYYYRFGEVKYISLFALIHNIAFLLCFLVLYYLDIVDVYHLLLSYVFVTILVCIVSYKVSRRFFNFPAIIGIEQYPLINKSFDLSGFKKLYRLRYKLGHFVSLNLFQALSKRVDVFLLFGLNTVIAGKYVVSVAFISVLTIGINFFNHYLFSRGLGNKEGLLFFAPFLVTLIWAIIGLLVSNLANSFIVYIYGEDYTVSFLFFYSIFLFLGVKNHLTLLTDMLLSKGAALPSLILNFACVLFGFLTSFIAISIFAFSFEMVLFVVSGSYIFISMVAVFYLANKRIFS